MLPFILLPKCAPYIGGSSVAEREYDVLSMHLLSPLRTNLTVHDLFNHPIPFSFYILGFTLIPPWVCLGTIGKCLILAKLNCAGDFPKQSDYASRFYTSTQAAAGRQGSKLRYSCMDFFTVIPSQLMRATGLWFQNLLCVLLQALLAPVCCVLVVSRRRYACDVKYY